MCSVSCFCGYIDANESNCICAARTAEYIPAHKKPYNYGAFRTDVYSLRSYVSAKKYGTGGITSTTFMGKVKVFP